MTEVAQPVEKKEAHALPARGANCGRALDGPYCSACGQKVVDFHRPLRELLSPAVEETLSDAKYQQLLARAKANPENFASAMGAFWVGFMGVMLIGLSTS